LRPEKTEVDESTKFSLILATLGRTDDFARFLRHLDQQTYRNFELIIVDQNSEGILDLLVCQYHERFPILHLRSERGLSRARNVGLQRVSGDIVAFPDDDCWYAPDLLESVASRFRQNSDWDGLTGKAVDDSRPGSYHRFPDESGWIDKESVWRQAVSITIFLQESVVRAIGPFDESLGAGSQFGKLSAEETDYLIRAVQSGFRIHYCPDVSIFHPDPASTYDHDLIKKAFGYSIGFGYVLRKHNYPISFVVHCWLRALGGALVSLATFNLAKSRYHFATLKGRVLGWLG
jgi:glycosyltransferase involved in cell wall biosynthesis